MQERRLSSQRPLRERGSANRESKKKGAAKCCCFWTGQNVDGWRRLGCATSRKCEHVPSSFSLNSAEDRGLGIPLGRGSVMWEREREGTAVRGLGRGAGGDVREAMRLAGLFSPTTDDSGALVKVRAGRGVAVFGLVEEPAHPQFCAGDRSASISCNHRKQAVQTAWSWQ